MASTSSRVAKSSVQKSSIPPIPLAAPRIHPPDPSNNNPDDYKKPVASLELDDPDDQKKSPSLNQRVDVSNEDSRKVSSQRSLIGTRNPSVCLVLFLVY